MPKIFALRDRLQAVQEYLNDNEDELEIFPEKYLAKNSRDTKYSLPLVKADPCSSLSENDIGLFGDDFIVKTADPLNYKYANNPSCNHRGNHISEQYDIYNATKPEDEDISGIATRPNTSKSAIETSKNGRVSTERIRAISPPSLYGKAYKAFLPIFDGICRHTTW